ncbi:MAG: DUF2180 family protein [Bryobacterales bacterium]|nr:DUF2180 family protein [Bryobacterales bacterium]
MNCMDCAEKKETRPAVAICHNCSAGLCREHALVLPHSVEQHSPICKTESADLLARRVFCDTCRRALAQVEPMLSD